MNIKTKTNLVAPCGMNCALCRSYHAKELDLNKTGRNLTYCSGCRPRGKGCLFFKGKCSKINKNKYCFECAEYPCKLIKNLDKRYTTKYGMSMIENLDYIKKKGIRKFMDQQDKKHACKKCNELINVHEPICYNCQLDK